VKGLSLKDIARQKRGDNMRVKMAKPFFRVVRELRVRYFQQLGIDGKNHTIVTSPLAKKIPFSSFLSCPLQFVPLQIGFLEHDLLDDKLQSSYF